MIKIEEKPRHITRWLVLLLLVAVGVVSMWLVKPARPEVSLAGETLLEHPLVTLPVLGNISLTNTLLTTVIVDAIVIILALAAGRGIRADGSPSRGIANVFETIFEALYNLVEQTVGKKWAKQVFPLVSTIIILVLTANLLKLFPGMESIGLIEPSISGETGHTTIDIVPGLVGLTATEATTNAYKLVPFFRSPSTDLNFTASLALIAVFMVQVFGVRANGPRYFGKFLNFGRFFNMGVKMWVKQEEVNAFDMMNPFIDIFVGILESISEFAKIISFSFRLLGSMFGGALLVVVMGTLLPVSQFGLYFLELFFGVVQALVFGMLTLVFISLVTKGHGKHG
ncbi:MAG: F0F1 ATP synthase subunit A [Anaerolineales bacterium]|nr:F0F1 ATP synthase subunit A [Anaerolineales bacterium]